MSPGVRGRRTPSAAGRVLTLAAAVLLSAACSEVASNTEAGYEPAHVQPVAGLDVPRVTFTPEAAERVQLQTVPVSAAGNRLVVPYAALIYDGEGASWVYTAAPPLTFLRTKVVVDRIDGGRVQLRVGPPAGTRVVTVGAAEVYGAELGIAGGH